MKNYIPKYDEFVNEGQHTIKDLPIVDWQRKQFDTLNAMYSAYLIDYAKSKGDKDAGKKTVWQLHDKYGKEIMSTLNVKSEKHADIATALIKANVIKESVINEGAVKAFEMDYADMVKNIKSGYGWIDPEYVADTWENTGNSIDFSIVKDEIYNRLIKAGLLYFADDNDEETKGKKVTNVSQIK